MKKDNQIQKHPGGRPTKYNEQMVLAVDQYLETTGREQTKLPTIEGLALYLGVDDDTIVEWSKEYIEFSAAVKKIKMLQKEQLINDSFYGGKEVNAAAGIFMLKVNHKMKDDSGVKVQVNNFIPLLGGDSVHAIPENNSDK